MLWSQPLLSCTPSNQNTTPNMLIIPPSPADCNQMDFKNAKFWTWGEWQRHQKRCKEQGNDCKKLDFLTDADGKPLDDDQIDSMMKHAWILWNSLYKEHEDPVTWSIRSMTGSTYFSNNMRIKYPELHLCEGDWKVHAFAMVWFPDCYGSTWARSQRGFRSDNHTIILDRTRNVPSYVSTCSASGDQVQTCGTYVKSMGKGTTEIIDLWWCRSPYNVRPYQGI